jgi:hypothetical protein
MQYLPLLIALVLLAGQTVLVLCKKQDEYVSWFGAVTSTLSSLLIGITIALAIFNYQNDIDDTSEKERYLKLLSQEITSINANLNAPDRASVTTHNEKHYVQFVGINSDVLTQAGLSGLFEEKHSFMMLDLSASIRFWNVKTEMFMNAFNSPSTDPVYDKRIKWYITNMDSARSGITTGINILSKELKIPIKKTFDYH